MDYRIQNKKGMKTEEVWAEVHFKEKKLSGGDAFC